MDASILVQTCDLWQPAENEDAATLQSKTLSWSTTSNDAICWFEPLSVDDKLAYFGDPFAKGFRLWLQITEKANIAEGYVAVCNSAADLLYGKGFTIKQVLVWDEVDADVQHIEAITSMLDLLPPGVAV